METNNKPQEKPIRLCWLDFDRYNGLKGAHWVREPYGLAKLVLRWGIGLISVQAVLTSNFTPGSFS